MDKVKLMTIEGTIMLPGNRLVLTPTFDLPSEDAWQNINERVVIQNPEGMELETEALLSVAHLNIRDPLVSFSKRWQIFISLSGIEKESVAVGSTVFVSPSTKKAVKGQPA